MGRMRTILLSAVLLSACGEYVEATPPDVAPLPLHPSRVRAGMTAEEALGVAGEPCLKAASGVAPSSGAAAPSVWQWPRDISTDTPVACDTEWSLSPAVVVYVAEFCPSRVCIVASGWPMHVEKE